MIFSIGQEIPFLKVAKGGVWVMADGVSVEMCFWRQVPRECFFGLQISLVYHASGQL